MKVFLGVGKEADRGGVSKQSEGEQPGKQQEDQFVLDSSGPDNL